MVAKEENAIYNCTAGAKLYWTAISVYLIYLTIYPFIIVSLSLWRNAAVGLSHGGARANQVELFFFSPAGSFVIDLTNYTAGLLGASYRVPC